VPSVKIAAPAKLNLHLSIGNRRPDGFHGIESLFLALGFGDTIHIETSPGIAKASAAIRMDWRLPGGAAPGPCSANEILPQEENIVSKAVSMFRSRTGYGEGLAIHIEKRIPMGGGLGGGSSNAASTLLALNRLASPHGGGLLDPGTLAEMGAALGSDVPFFMHGAAAAIVSGRGETVRPIAVPRQALGLSLLLVNPGFHSDTAKAFRLLDEYRQMEANGTSSVTRLDSNPFMPQNPAFRAFSPQVLQDILAGPPRNWPFYNDFLPAFTERKENTPFYEAGSAYVEIISGLKGLGADFAGLSGSGSTCFGVFSQKNTVKFAKKLLLKRWQSVFETITCVPTML